MKDIPVFTTENGVASLTLQEITTQGCAYIRIQSAMEPINLLDDCIGFCRMVGASRIFATGDSALEAYPLRTAIWEMACARDTLEDTDAALWPMQEKTAAEFREIYNRKIAHVPNAAWMSEKEVMRIVAAGEGYFVHRGQTLIGIGIVDGNEIRFVASLAPGEGMSVVRALANSITEDRVTLQVASANEKAVKLYEKLGFVTTREISRWYCVFEEGTH